MIELRPEFRFSNQIWPNLPRFEPFCLDLAYFAWIWAILIGFGPICLDLGPKGDKALRMGRGGWMDLRSYGRTDSPCVLQDFVPFAAAAQKTCFYRIMDSICVFKFSICIYFEEHLIVPYISKMRRLFQEMLAPAQ